MTELPAFLEVMRPFDCVARVPSSDGEREYQVTIAFVPDGEARYLSNAGGSWAVSCRCKGWRLGSKDGSIETDWCKHIRSTFEEWAHQQAIVRRGRMHGV